MTEWKSKKVLELDGFISTSLSEETALAFAQPKKGDTEKMQVLLKIEFENLKGRYYISLDREDYTIYPDEDEILLQSGIIAKKTGF